MLLLILVILGFVAFSVTSSRISARDILSFLLSSSISIFVLILIVGILAGMGQGTTIVISLFWEPANLLLMIFAIHFLALILSHFPEYFMVALSDQKGKFKWLKSNGGIIYYEINHDNKTTSDNHSEKSSYIYLSFFRREIGILTYVLWIFILLTVYEHIYGCYNINVLSILGFGILAVVHFILETKKKEIDQEERASRRLNMAAKKKYLRLFQLFFWIHIFLIGTTCLHVASNNITEGNLLLLIIATYQGALLYVLFRVFRGWFKHFKKNEDNLTGQEQEGHVSSILPFYHFSYTVSYLGIMRVVGMFFAIMLLMFVIFPNLNINNINPVPVFIIILILYYSALVLTIKKYLFYNKKYVYEKTLNPDIGWTHNRKMAIVAGITPIAFLVYTSFGTSVNNDLHTLQMKAENNLVDQDLFIKNLKVDSSLKSHFIIGVYGGGLKANAWTLLTLRQLEKTVGREFIESTLCMSGVSGGALGIGNYTMISRYLNNNDNSAWDNTMLNIGSANVLSSDLSGWLISDLLRDPLPINFNGNDRANESMKNYQTIIGDTLANKTSFKQFWADTYRSNKSQFPAILINTTPTQSKYGIACSVDKMNDFPIMIDILNHGNGKSPTFLAAVSTSNRFPLFSPAARIKNKGHFVDGGYFDNSGLLNARSFYRQLEKNPLFESKKREKVIAINIMNDRINYILSKENIRKIMEGLVKPETSEGEINSIVGGIAALERMPNYVREEIETDPNMELIKIQMPHRFSFSDIQRAYCTTGLDETLFDDIIEENDRMIQEALECAGYDKSWGTVEPPLGRLLSIPAVKYEAAMLSCHAEIKITLAQIKSELHASQNTRIN